MSVPRRVLYVAHSVDAHGGGMERIGRAMIDHMTDVEWSVIASDGLDDLGDDVETIRVALPARPAFVRIAWFYLRSGREIRRIRHRIDVVHSCGAVTSEPVDLATVHLCHAAVPEPTALTGARWRQWNAWLARWLGRAIERRQFRDTKVGRLVAVSASVEAQLAEHYPGIARQTIVNGVDVERWLQPRRPDPASERLRVLMVTGDFALKGVDLAIDALGEVPDAELVVVGAGPIEEYRSLGDSRGVADRVRFLGHREDLEGIYAHSDVIVCVSRYESFGLNMVEAALGGCAVVATDVGIARDLIGGGGGLLIERNRASLVGALQHCAADRSALAARGAVARENARVFTLNAMYDRYRSLYAEITDASALVRVLHVGLESPSTRIGGLNRYLDELARAQRAAGVDASIVWVAATFENHARAVSPRGSFFGRMVGFARAIRASKADIIDVHFAAHAYLALRWGALAGRPLVVHFQGPWALESRTAGASRLNAMLKAHLEGYVIRRADVVITLSSAFRAIAIERYRASAQRVRVLAPGVNLSTTADRQSSRARLNLGSNDVLWVSVRRLVARMGLDVALRALALAPPEHRYVIVGVGPLRDELEELARSLGVADRVDFVGHVGDDELAQYYAAADVTLVPSVAHEGFGLVVLESLAQGTPVVASDLEGLRDARRLSGAISLAALSPEAIWRAVEDSVGRPLLRSVAMVDVASLGWSGLAATHVELYRSLLNGERARGVVVLDHTARLSGGELAMARLMSALDDRWRAHVILAEHGPLEDELTARSISFEVLELARRTRDLSRDALGLATSVVGGFDSLTYVVRLRRRLSALSPDVVHSNSMKAHLYGSLASIGAPWKLVLHVRDRWSAPYLSARTARLMRLVARFGPDAILANSRDTAIAIGSQASVLASPVEDDFFGVRTATTHPRVRVAVVGRLAPWKGQDLAIDAIADLREECNVELTIAGEALFGEDDFARSLHERVRARHCEDIVHLVGHVDDVPEFLNDVDVVVLTSRSPEPFGNVIVEAMAAGRTVVVPNRGGVTEFVSEDGPRGSGFFYEMGDLASLTAVLGRVCRDPALRLAVGRRARDAVTPFSAHAVAGALEQFYDDLT